MRVSKWGNSLAIRLPLAVVKELALMGDQVDVRISGERVVAREQRPTATKTPARFQIPSRWGE